MAKNILDIVLKTINEVQKNNQTNPNIETADPNVFDLIKGKLQDIDQKSRNKRASKGKTPESIFDLIKNQIEGARKENEKDPNVKTAPGSIFDEILNKIDQKPQKQARKGIRRIIDEYNIDVQRIPANVLNQIEAKFVADKKNFDRQYAQAIYDVSRKY